MTSARLVAQPPAGRRACTNIAPLDVPRFMAPFLDHWRPDLVLIAESELWPNMLVEAAHARGMPLALVNARLSAALVPAAGGASAHFIARCWPRSTCASRRAQDDAGRFLLLGAPRVQVVGNLKYDVPRAARRQRELAELRGQRRPRPVWVAASTHAGEEEIVAQAHLGFAPPIPIS